MCSLPVFVGLDYHDSSVRVCVLDSDGSELANADRTNDWQAIAQFAERFGRPVRAAIESCCGAADLAEGLSAVGASYNRAQRAGSLAGEATIGRTGAFGHQDPPGGEATRAYDRQRRGSATVATAAGYWPGDGLDHPRRDRSL